MNLYEMGQMAEAEMRYAPTVNGWKSDLYAVLDRVHKQLVTSRPWPFMVKHRPLILLPDMNVIVGLIASPSLPGRTLTVIPGLLSGFGFIKELQSTAAGGTEGLGFLTLQLGLGAGCEVHLHDSYRVAMLADTGSNWSYAPFRIEQVQSFYTFALEPLARITTLPGLVSSAPLDHGQAVVTIKQPRVRLPADCAEVLRVYGDDGVPLAPVTREEWLRSAYNRMATAPFDGAATGQTGTPRWMLEDPGQEDRIGWNRPDGHSEISTYTAPELAPGFSVFGAGAGGSWPAGSWEAALCWYSAATPPIYGSLTRPFPFTTVALNQVQLLSVPVLPSADYGRQLAVFIRDASVPNRPFVFAGDNQTSRTVTSIVIQAPPSRVPIETSSAVRYEDVAGPYQYLRLFPRTDKLRRCVLEYVRRPRALLGPEDMPDLPLQFHPAIVWLALEQLTSRDDPTFAKSCAVHAAQCLRPLLGSDPLRRYAVRMGAVDQGGMGLPFIDRDNVRNPL